MFNLNFRWVRASDNTNNAHRHAWKQHSTAPALRKVVKTFIKQISWKIKAAKCFGIYFDDYKISNRYKVCVCGVWTYTCMELDSILMGNYIKTRKNQQQVWTRCTRVMHAIYSCLSLTLTRSAYYHTNDKTIFVFGGKFQSTCWLTCLNPMYWIVAHRKTVK